MRIPHSRICSYRREKRPKSGTIFDRGNLRRLLVALAFNVEKLFRRASRCIHFLAELEPQNWIVNAVNDKDGRHDFLQI